ncbi:MAG: stage II sporulation protein M [Clostridiaceae bacterium]|nr:stage II sporulation protein M [Clostridiaceae bacterium]
MLTRIKELICLHVTNNSLKYFFLILFYATGIIAGAIFAGALPPEKSDDLMAVISGFCNGLNDGEIKPSLIFSQSILNNIKAVALLYACTVSVYLLPLIYLHITARGFVIGFTVGFMNVFFGFQGFLFAFVSVFPQLIVLIPVIMAMSVMSQNYLTEKRRASQKHFLNNEKKHCFIKFSYLTLAYCLFMVIPALIDAFVIPVFVRSIVRVF